MTIGSIILIILGVFALIGIGTKAIQDFNVPVLGLVLALATIVGLNFVTPFVFNNFVFSIGTGILFFATFALWLFRGNFNNKILCLVTILILSALTFGATRLAYVFGNKTWSSVNFYYALMIGFLSFISTRNAKYGFIASVLTIMIATLLTQINRVIDLNEAYSTAIVSGAFSIVMYSTVSALMPKKPSRMAYYYEMGRMKDR
ncbi:MAG: hypothetical protein WCR54_05315 [Clostridia bacterium]